MVKKTIQLNVGNLVYYKFLGGNSEVYILYIHGLGPITSSFIKEISSQLNEYSLSEYSWIIPHLIGFGKSEKPDKLEVYTMENQGRYLYELLHLEKVCKVIIVAHSLGGPVAISLIDKIQNQSNGEIEVKGLFYLEGNLDKNDTFLSSRIAKYPFEEFKQNFNNWTERMINQLNLDYSENGPYSIWGSAYDLVELSDDQLLPRLQKLIDFPVYFIFGEKNKGRFTSEELVKSKKLPVIYIPNTGHSMFFENPQEFWPILKELLKSCF